MSEFRSFFLNLLRTSHGWHAEISDACKPCLSSLHFFKTYFGPAMAGTRKFLMRASHVWVPFIFPTSHGTQPWMAHGTFKCEPFMAACCSIFYTWKNIAHWWMVNVKLEFVPFISVLCSPWKILAFIQKKTLAFIQPKTLVFIQKKLWYLYNKKTLVFIQKKFWYLYNQKLWHLHKTH